MNQDPQFPALYTEIVERVMAPIREELAAGKFISARMLIGSTRTGQELLIEMPFSNDEEKLACTRHCRHIASIINADYSVFGMEAYILQVQDLAKSEALLKRYGSVSKVPGRIDALSIGLETPLGTWLASAQIEPHKVSKKRRQLGKLDFFYADGATGYFANILPKTEADPTGRRAMH